MCDNKKWSKNEVTVNNKSGLYDNEDYVMKSGVYE